MNSDAGLEGGVVLGVRGGGGNDGPRGRGKHDFDEDGDGDGSGSLPWVVVLANLRGALVRGSLVGIKGRLVRAIASTGLWEPGRVEGLQLTAVNLFWRTR